MFEKVSQIAEQAATNVSRRQFFWRVGISSLALAGALGAILALPAATARAGRPAAKLLCCIYHCEPRDPCDRPTHYLRCLSRSKCPGGYRGCKLEIERVVADCSECR